MDENTMAQFKTEGQPAFPVLDKENDNSPESPAGETTTTQTQSEGGESKPDGKKDDGGKENFADHPRWKEREDDWKKRYNEQEERHVSEIAKLREEIDGKFNQHKQATAPTEVPPWFGGDEEAWSEFTKWNESQISRAKEEARKEALHEITSKSEKEQKALDEATKYFDDEVKSIESDKELNPEGREVDRNKLLKFALDNELVDTKGRWNYRAAFKMMGADKVFRAKQALNERKQIANATTSENRAESKAPSYMTSDDFKKPGARPW